MARRKSDGSPTLRRRVPNRALPSREGGRGDQRGALLALAVALSLEVMESQSAVLLLAMRLRTLVY